MTDGYTVGKLMTYDENWIKVETSLTHSRILIPIQNIKFLEPTEYVDVV